MLMQSTLSHPARSKGHQVRAMDVFSAVEQAHFQRDCNASKNTGKQSSGKGKQSKSWSKSEGKGRVRRTRENAKGNPKDPKVRTKVPKARTRAKHRKLVSQVLKT